METGPEMSRTLELGAAKIEFESPILDFLAINTLIIEPAFADNDFH